VSEADFTEAQRAFAAHIRDPENAPAPTDVEERRLKIYRDLFYNNIANFLDNGFPVIRSLLPEQRWQEMVRAFMAGYAAHSPYFVDIPKEFVEFLAQEGNLAPSDPPFLLELAHYEWMELVLDVSRESIPDTGFNPDGDLLRGAPFVSPLTVVLSYHFPVHQIGKDFQPDAPLAQPVWLLVYRDAQDEVRFMEINAVTARLLSLLEEEPGATGETILARIAGELGAVDSQQVMAFGLEAMEKLRQRDIILGTRLREI
jgi:hypothetical protein